VLSADITNIGKQTHARKNPRKEKQYQRYVTQLIVLCSNVIAGAHAQGRYRKGMCILLLLLVNTL
jgi:hypothetical protein